MDSVLRLSHPFIKHMLMLVNWIIFLDLRNHHLLKHRGVESLSSRWFCDGCPLVNITKRDTDCKICTKKTWCPSVRNDDEFMDLQVAIMYNHSHMVHFSPQTNHPISVPLISLETLVPLDKKNPSNIFQTKKKRVMNKKTAIFGWVSEFPRVLNQSCEKSPW